MHLITLNFAGITVSSLYTSSFTKCQPPGNRSSSSSFVQSWTMVSLSTFSRFFFLVPTFLLCAATTTSVMSFSSPIPLSVADSASLSISTPKSLKDSCPSICFAASECFPKRFWLSIAICSVRSSIFSVSFLFCSSRADCVWLSWTHSIIRASFERLLSCSADTVVFSIHILYQKKCQKTA